MADEPADSGTEFDLDAGVESIAKDIFPPTPEPEAEAAHEEVAAAAPETPAATPAATETPQSRPAPKAWPKDMHEHWPKLDPKVQGYLETREKQMLDGLGQYKTDATFGKNLRDAIAPYRPIIAAAGLDETTAVQTLLNAHYRLTQGPQESRLAAYQELGKNLGLVTGDTSSSATDPALKAVLDRMHSLESTVLARDQAAMTEAQTRIAKEVDAFASDPGHAYFDEVADDVVAMIRAGFSLQDAYDKAVWANPVTRQKELARLNTENEKKLRENARLDALKAEKAKSTNIRGRETERAPTEPLGSMEDTMRSELRRIKDKESVH